MNKGRTVFAQLIEYASHKEFRGPVARTTLADANEQRDWRIYAEFAQGLIAEARQMRPSTSFFSSSSSFQV